MGGKSAAHVPHLASTPACTSLLQFLLLRALSCLSRCWDRLHLPLLTSGVSLLLTGMVSLLAAAASHYTFGHAITQRILAVAESTTTTAKRTPQPRLYSSDNLTALPDPVQRYLRYALQEGQSLVRFVCTKQTGTYRTALSSDGWRRMHAEQYLSVTEPGFVWSATIELVPCVWLRGWDSYIRGRGNMFWKLCSLFTVEDTRGDDVDRSDNLIIICYSTLCCPSSLTTSYTGRCCCAT